jgi:hypothetical protein
MLDIHGNKKNFYVISYLMYFTLPMKAASPKRTLLYALFSIIRDTRQDSGFE